MTNTFARMLPFTLLKVGCHSGTNVLLKSEDNFAKVTRMPLKVPRHFFGSLDPSRLRKKTTSTSSSHSDPEILLCFTDGTRGRPNGSRVPLCSPALLCAAEKRLDLVYRHVEGWINSEGMLNTWTVPYGKCSRDPLL